MSHSNQPALRGNSGVFGGGVLNSGDSAWGRVRQKLLGSTALAGVWSVVSLLAALGAAGAAYAGPPASTQLPTNGQVTAGSAGISQSGAAMAVNQTSQRAVVDWGSFDVGASAKVQFNQPSASSATLNRVHSSNPSQIYGQVTANGQLYFSNPNGVYFAPGSSVDVGGLVATTHSISNADFMAGKTTLNRNGAAGAIVNDGTLTAGLGGYIALLAPEVRNQGVIVAQLGTVALAAGETYELQFEGNNTLANIRVTPATIKALVENKSAVKAPGGLIILSAQAVDRLQGGVVNNSGSLEATGLVNDGGKIILAASDAISHSGVIKADAAPDSVGKGGAGKGGTVSVIADLTNSASRTEVSGSISARGGSRGGDGGQIETSASKLRIAATAKVDTQAPKGLSGTWVLDPTDFTISAGDTAQTDSGVGAQTLEAALAAGNVTIATAAVGGDLGDINVNADLLWSANKLTLTAHNNININAYVNALGSSTLALNPGATGTVKVGFDNSGRFKGNVSFGGRSGDGILTIAGSDYTIITSLGAEGSVTGTDFQGINGDLTKNYALGADIDASSTATWESGAGFKPIGNVNFVTQTYFSKAFDGLGHTVTGLTINRNDFVLGLFQGLDGSGNTTASSSVNYSLRNLGLESISLSGGGFVTGSLAGMVAGAYTVSNVYVTGSQAAQGMSSGGLVGVAMGAFFTDVHADVTVTNDWVPEDDSTTATGGLFGALGNSSLRNAYATGAVTGTTVVGGLAGGAGVEDGGALTISNVYATGSVTAVDTAGGLIGSLTGGTLRDAYATGSVTASGSNGQVGGLIGLVKNASTVTNAYATGAVSAPAGNYVGGLVGALQSGTFYNTFAANSVSGADYVGGYAGSIGAAAETVSIDSAFWNGTVTATGSTIGLFAGEAITGATISNAYAISNAFFAEPSAFLGGGAGAVLTNAVANNTFTGIFSVPATTNPWTGAAGDGLWTSAGNWGLGHVPTVLEFAYVDGISVSIPSIALVGGFSANAGSTVSFTGATVSSLALVNSMTAGVLGGNPGDVTLNFGTSGKLNVPTATSLMVNGETYTVITKLGAAGDQNTNAETLQGIARFSNRGDDTVRYMLGMDIDASATADWNSGAGFFAIGLDSDEPFTGVFNGMGHSVNYLTINNNFANQGLFGYTGSNATISNVGLISADVRGASQVGALVGKNTGKVDNAWATGTVTGVGTFVAGQGVTAGYDVGGLLGMDSGDLSRIHADVTVTGTESIGGLIGSAIGISLTGAYATGAVEGSRLVGGLIGFAVSQMSVTSSYATGPVTAKSGGSGIVGGLIGFAQDGIAITSSFASGSVTDAGNEGVVGGLVGKAQSGYGNSSITASYALGNVQGYLSVGGLVGEVFSGGSTIDRSFAIGAVTMTAGQAGAGGLVGNNVGGVLSDVYATGAVTGDNQVGGLVGINTGTIQRAYSTGAVLAAGAFGATAGGLVGDNTGGTVTDSFWNKTANSDPALDNGVGTGKTLTELQTWSTYPAGWDFTTPGAMVWNIRAGGTPYLCGVTGSCVVQTEELASSSSSGSSSSGGSSSGSSSSSSGGSSSGSSSSGGSSSGSSSSSGGSSSGSSSSGGSSSGSSSSSGGSSSGSSSSGGSSSGSSSSSGGSSSGSSSSGGSSSGSSSSSSGGSSSGSSSSGGVSSSSSSGGSSSSGSSSGVSSSSGGSSSGSSSSGGTSSSSSSGGSSSGSNSSSGGVSSSSSSGGAPAVAPIPPPPPVPPQPSLPQPSSSSGGLSSSGGSGASGGVFTSSPTTTSGGLTSASGGLSGGLGGSSVVALGGATTGGSAALVAPGQTTTSGGNGAASNSTSATGSSSTAASGALGSTGSTSAGTSNNDNAAAGAGTGISISLLRPPSANDTGVVTVSVPRATAVSGTGFSFPLPAQVTDAGSGAAAAPVLVTTQSGEPLPSWIRFDADTRTFVASTVPDGGLPIQVLVRVGEKTSTIVISERAESASNANN